MSACVIPYLSISKLFPSQKLSNIIEIGFILVSHSVNISSYLFFKSVFGSRVIIYMKFNKSSNFQEIRSYIKKVKIAYK